METYRLEIEVNASGAKSQLERLDSEVQNLISNSGKLDKAIGKNEQAFNDCQNAMKKTSQATEKTKKAFDDAKNSVDKMGKQVKQTGDDAKDTAKKLDGLSATLGRLKGMVGGAFAFLGISAGFSAILETADAMKTLDGQIKIATGTAEKHAFAMKEIERVAMANKVSLESVGSLYVSNERSLKQLGKSQQEVVKFTENITQAMAVGGGSAESQAAALTQLGQAMASGVLRGDEFNSIAEQAPVIMELMADSLKVTTGELRKMAAEGKLTATAVYDALTSADASQKLAERTKQSGTTIQGALENIRTQWDLAIDDFMNKEGGISSLIADGLVLIGDGMQGIGDYMPIVSQHITSVIDKAKELAQAFLDSEVGKAIIDGLTTAFDSLKTALDNVVGVAERVFGFFRDNEEITIALASGISAVAVAFGVYNGAILIATATTTAFAAVATVAASAFAIITSPVTLVVAAIASLVAVSVYLYRNWDDIKAKAGEVWEGVKNTVSEAWESIKTAISEKIESIKQFFSEWLASAPAPVQEMVENISSLIGGIVKVFKATWQAVVDVTAAVWSSIKEVASKAWDGLVEIVGAVWHKIKIYWGQAKPYFQALWGAIKQVFDVAWRAMITPVQVAWQAIKAAARFGIDAIKAIITAGVSLFATIFNTAFNAIKIIFTTAFGIIKGLVTGDMGAVKDAFNNGIQQAKELLGNTIDQIVGIFTSLGGKLLQAGKDAIQGFINGVQASIGKALEVIGSLANQVVSAFQNPLKIRSPSRVMIQQGEFVVDGVIVGIKNKVPKAVKQTKQMAQEIIKATDDAIADWQKRLVLFGNDSELASLDYDIAMGKYGGRTKELRDLVAKYEQREKTQAFDDEINSIRFETWKIGKSELEIYQESLKLNKNLTDEQRQQLVNAKQMQILTQETLDANKKQSDAQRELEKRQQEKQAQLNQRLEDARFEFEKRKAMLTDPYAGVRMDAQRAGFDENSVNELVNLKIRDDQLNQVKTVMDSLSNKSLFSDTSITANLGQPSGGAEFAVQFLTNSQTLSDQLQKAQEELRAAREQGLIEEEEYLKQSELLTEQHAVRKRQLMETATSSIMGGLTAIAKRAFGEQSRAYKLMFALEKGMAVARILIANKTALAQAWASAPFPANMGAVGKVLLESGAIMAAVKAVSPIGQAHDGIMSVPKSGTWNLEKGERVLPKHTAKAMDKKLETIGTAGNQINITVNVDANGNSQTQGAEGFGKRMADGVKATVLDILRQERRQGGLLYGT